jgi:hypothetical protein
MPPKGRIKRIRVAGFSRTMAPFPRIIWRHTYETSPHCCSTVASCVELILWIARRMDFRWAVVRSVFSGVHKITKNDCYMSARPSIRTEQLSSHWTDFHEIWSLSIFFRKSIEKIQVSLKSFKNWCTTWRPIYIFLIITRSFLLSIRNVSDKGYLLTPWSRVLLEKPTSKLCS